MSWWSLSPRVWSRNRRWQEDVLAAHADALISNGAAHASPRQLYADPAEDELAALLRLAERVERAMPPVTLSEAYVAQLRHRLLESDLQETLSLWRRIRQLPPRTQLAAGIGGATLTAGVVILATRSVYDVLGSRRNRRTVIA